jgi:predicted RNA-binding Zn-ribbon protein involved in translation (DUF1610 family)
MKKRKEKQVKRQNKKLKVRFCPRCGSNDIMAVLGFKLGSIYECKKCGFRGALFPEQDLEEFIKLKNKNGRKK